MEKLNLKTPITYYGGKQKMVNHILPLIPEHSLYAEPFAGGAAIFWAKQPVSVEVLNDTNRELINFYKVVKNNFVELEKEIKISPKIVLFDLDYCTFCFGHYILPIIFYLKNHH